MTRLKYVNKSPNPNPSFADKGSSGFDLRAWINEENGGSWDENQQNFAITLKPLERKLIHTGLYFELPDCGEIQVRPRSGLALKEGVTVLNAPGSVDASYTGEVGVILINLSNKNVMITNNERIAQGVFSFCVNGYDLDLILTEKITKQTERGDGGFGHTGKI